MGNSAKSKRKLCWQKYGNGLDVYKRHLIHIIRLYAWTKSPKQADIRDKSAYAVSPGRAAKTRL